MSGRRIRVVDDELRILDIVRCFPRRGGRLEPGGHQVEAFLWGPQSEETPVLFMSSKVETS